MKLGITMCLLSTKGTEENPPAPSSEPNWFLPGLQEEPVLASFLYLVSA